MDKGIFFPSQQSVIMVEGFYNLRKKQVCFREDQPYFSSLCYEDFNDVDKIDARIDEVGDDETNRHV
jgi:hypothetical protein